MRRNFSRVWIVSLAAAAVVGTFLLLRGDLASGRVANAAGGELALEQDLIAYYDGVDLAGIQEELQALQKYLDEETKDYYEARFQAGEYELVTKRRQNGAFALESEDQLVSWRLLAPDKLGKVVLPYQGFEDAYAAKDRAEFLMEEAHQRALRGETVAAR